MARVTFRRSDRSLSDRLGVEPGCRLLVIGAPLPAIEGWDATRVAHDADVVVAACLALGDVIDLVPRGWAARRAGGRLWVAYRRGRKELTRDDVGKAIEGLGLGLTWFRQTAVDDVWSAIWFKHRSEFRTLRH